MKNVRMLSSFFLFCCFYRPISIRKWSDHHVTTLVVKLYPQFAEKKSIIEECRIIRGVHLKNVGYSVAQLSDNTDYPTRFSRSLEHIYTD